MDGYSTMRNLGRVGVFSHHPNLGEGINRNFCQSEIEGGVLLTELPIGSVLEIETQHRTYYVKNLGNGQVLITGHPEYCPSPTSVKVHGSTWGTAMLKMRYIGRGMHMEFRHPTMGVIRTSRVMQIRELPPEAFQPDEPVSVV